MSKPPEISVVLPVYNGGLYLEQALQSVLAQTFDNFELIAVDDGSTDDSWSTLVLIDDPRVRLFRNPANVGLYECLNFAIDHCRGRYIARMDADDISDPRRLSEQYAALEADPELVLCGTMAATFDGATRYAFPESDAEIKALMFWTCPIAHPSVMLRRTTLKDLDPVYDTRYRYAADYDLWIRLMQRGRFRNISDTLVRYRKHESQLTHRLAPAALEEPDDIRWKTVRYLISRDDPGERQLHMRLLHHEPPDDVEGFVALNDYLGRVEDWISRLIAANCTKELYPEPAFSSQLIQASYAYARLLLGYAREHSTGACWSDLAGFWLGTNKLYRYFAPRQRLDYSLRCLFPDELPGGREGR